MPELLLVRNDISDRRIFGEIYFEDLRCVDTLERPWKANKEYLSCIPEGTYDFRVFKDHHKFGLCIEVLDVPGRKGIFMHTANKVEQVEGCIAIGFRAGDLLKDSRYCLDSLVELVRAGGKVTIRSDT